MRSGERMRILITGGAGFIGSHLVEGYLAEGHDVAVVDDLSTGAAHALPPGARLYPIDVRSRELDDVIATERPDLVSHHAARVGGRDGAENLLGDAEVNLLGSLNVMEAVRRHGVPRIVLASAGLYEECDGRRTAETHRCRPRSAHAVATLTTEHFLASYATRGVQAIVLRYASVYGPRQVTGVVARFIERILAGQPATIFGDGSRVRDFVHVEDVARAHLAAGALAPTSGSWQVFNVGTGLGTSILSLWRALARISGTSASPVHEPARLGEAGRSVLDPTRARHVLGWEPLMALGPGLERRWAWFLARTPARMVA
jgi:UDP-glucose 4-epimerase